MPSLLGLLMRGPLILAAALLMLGAGTARAAAFETLSGGPLPPWFKTYDPTHEVDIEQSTLIMRDGAELSVTYFKPVPKQAGERFPVVLEMLPYRKDDYFYARDYPIYRYLAERGIGGARIDIRGTGSSGGRLVDREYSDAELADLEEPVYTIGALLDGYRDYVINILDHVKSPVRAEIGPWNHAFPDTGAPGPNYDFKQSAVRWWKQWLAGEDAGITREPNFVTFVRGAIPASNDYALTPGAFHAPGWPIPGEEPVTLQLGSDSSLQQPAGPENASSLPRAFQ